MSQEVRLGTEDGFEERAEVFRSTPATPRRIQAIDTIRGTAMLMVIFSHTRLTLDPTSVSPAVYSLLTFLTNSATVAFMFVSGLMLNFFIEGGRPWDEVRRRFAYRAVILLACHPLINALTYPARISEWPFWKHMFLHFPITDTLAIALLIGPLVLKYVSTQKRTAVIVLLLVVSPALAIFFQPVSPLLQTTKEILVGELYSEPMNVEFAFPLLPWLAIFLSGTLMGGSLANLQCGWLSISELHRRSLMVTLKLIALTMAAVVGYKLLRLPFAEVWDIRFFHLLYPLKTTTLLPAYLGGIIAAIVFLLRKIDKERRWFVYRSFASVIGRNSLFTFLVQFIVTLTVPVLLGVRYNLTFEQFIVAVTLTTITCWLLAFLADRFREMRLEGRSQIT